DARSAEGRCATGAGASTCGPSGCCAASSRPANPMRWAAAYAVPNNNVFRKPRAGNGMGFLRSGSCDAARRLTDAHSINLSYVCEGIVPAERQLVLDDTCKDQRIEKQG